MWCASSNTRSAARVSMTRCGRACWRSCCALCAVQATAGVAGRAVSRLVFGCRMSPWLCPWLDQQHDSLERCTVSMEVAAASPLVRLWICVEPTSRLCWIALVTYPRTSLCPERTRREAQTVASTQRTSRNMSKHNYIWQKRTDRHWGQQSSLRNWRHAHRAPTNIHIVHPNTPTTP